MKFNWGTGITIAYVLFAAGIGLLVYKASQQTNDLVTENYYDKAVDFQQQIDAENHVVNEKESLTFLYKEESHSIEVQFPENHGITSGSFLFYKPDNAASDFVVEMNPKDNKIQVIQSDKLTRGIWLIKTSWKIDSTSYYQEEKLFIP